MSVNVNQVAQLFSTENDLEKTNFEKSPSNYPQSLINLNFRVSNPNLSNLVKNEKLWGNFQNPQSNSMKHIAGSVEMQKPDQMYLIIICI